MGDALLVAMSSSGLSNMDLDNLVEVVPAVDMMTSDTKMESSYSNKVLPTYGKFTSETISELASTSLVVKEKDFMVVKEEDDVKMLVEYSAKPAKRRRLNQNKNSDHLSFSNSPIVPSFINITPSSASIKLTNTQTQITRNATVLLNKQRQDQQAVFNQRAAERLLNKYKTAGKASLGASENPGKLPWGSSNAFNTNKQNFSFANNVILGASPIMKPQLKPCTNIFGLGGGDVVKRTVILKNLDKINNQQKEAATDAKTTLPPVALKPTSALLEVPKSSIGVSSTITTKHAESTTAKTIQDQSAPKPIPALVDKEDPVKRYSLYLAPSHLLHLL